MQIVSYSDSDPTFQTLLGQIQKRVTARLVGAGKLCSPTQTPFIGQSVFTEFLSRAQNPVDFRYLSFAFKKARDPANLYPLRYIRGVARTGQEYYVGSDTKNKDLAVQQQIDLDQIKQIQKITTFFSQAKKVDGDTSRRYQTRIVAFVISYKGTDDQDHEELVCSQSSDFYALKTSKSVLNDCLDLVAKGAGGNRDYAVAYEQNADGLNFQPDPINPQKRICITNVAYELIVGASREYISNFAMISTLPMKVEELIPPSITGIQFEMPFRPNSTGEKIMLETESGSHTEDSSVVATQKSHNFSVGIPQISVGVPGGPSVTIGQIAGYSYASSHKSETHTATGAMARTKFNQTIPEKAYVLDNVQKTKDFLATSKLSLLGADAKCLVEISVPTMVPCFNVASADDLATEIVNSI